jgi:hypothetical protein
MALFSAFGRRSTPKGGSFITGTEPFVDAGAAQI